MANLSLLYLAEIVSGLRYKALHLTANFNQLITRSNLQDSQIASLQAGETAAEGRLTAAEANIETAQADINTLEAIVGQGGTWTSSDPFTVDLDSSRVIYVTGYTLGTVKLPYAGGLAGGQQVVLHSNENLISWELEVWNASGSATATYTIRGGFSAVATLVKPGSGDPAQWRVAIEAGGLVDSSETVISDRSLDASDFVSAHYDVSAGSTDTITLTLPKIDTLGLKMVLATVRASSAFCTARIKSHADDGGITIATATNAEKHYLLASDERKNRWHVVELTTPS